MAYLGNDLQVAFPVYRKIDNIAGSFNGVTKTFALTVNGVAPVPAPLYSQQCLISVAGVVQQPDDTGVKGFRLSGNNIIFASAPAGGADFFGIILAGADYVDAGGNYPSGTASVPSITFNDDLDTGIYNSGINQLSFSTGGSERLRIDSAGQIEASYLGTAAAPTYSFIGDPNTGIYSPGADQVTISTGGTGQVFVDASGKVGIGTNLPSAKTEIASSGSETSLILRNTSSAMSSYSELKFAPFTGTTAASAAIRVTYAQDNNSQIEFRTTNVNAEPVERLRIASDGKVGIGTSSPNYALDVRTTGTTISSSFTSDQSEQYIALKDSGTTLGHVRLGSTSGAMLFNAGNAERLRITSTGNVGIGTSGPGSKLEIRNDVQATTSLDTTAIKLYNNLDGGSGIEFLNAVSGKSKISFGVEGTGGATDDTYLGFSTSLNAGALTERMRITSNGNVGIGTSSPSQTLHVENTNLVNPSLTWGASATQTIRVSAIRELALGVTGASPYDCYLQARNNVNTAQALLLNPVGGNVGIGTSSPDSKLHVAGAGVITHIAGTYNFDGFYAGAWGVNGGAKAEFIAHTSASNSRSWRISHDTDSAAGALLFSYADSAASYGSLSYTERLRIDSSGRLLVGTSTAANNIRLEQSLAVVRTGSGYGGMSLTSYVGTTVGNCPVLDFQRSRGTTDGSLTKVQSGDRLGVIAFRGANGTTFSDGALIDCWADGEWNTAGDTSDSPGRLAFWTAPDGSDVPTERMRITSGGFVKASNTTSYLYDLGLFHEFNTSENDTCGLGVKASNASLTIPVIYVETSRASNSAFSFFAAWGVADREFNLRGDGNAFADGTWTGGGADYAEYFEWVDSNPNAEDRRGISVVLDGNKIREALPGEDPIGVISGNPSVVGDAAWNKWSGKHLRDEYGSYLLDQNGDRQLNPAYDPDAEYIPREQRPEWDCVGLMGKLRIRKGQVTGSRWIKMRDISTTVEEWLVR